MSNTQGRPIKREGEKPELVSIYFYRKNLDALTRLEAAIRLAQGARIQRSGIVRAILEGIDASGLDLTACADEDAIRELVAASIKPPNSRKKAAPKGKKAAK